MPIRNGFREFLPFRGRRNWFRSNPFGNTWNLPPGENPAAASADRELAITASLKIALNRLIRAVFEKNRYLRLYRKDPAIIVKLRRRVDRTKTAAVVTTPSHEWTISGAISMTARRKNRRNSINDKEFSGAITVTRSRPDRSMSIRLCLSRRRKRSDDFFVKHFKISTI